MKNLFFLMKMKYSYPRCYLVYNKFKAIYQKMKNSNFLPNKFQLRVIAFHLMKD